MICRYSGRCFCCSLPGEEDGFWSICLPSELLDEIGPKTEPTGMYDESCIGDGISLSDLGATGGGGPVG